MRAGRGGRQRGGDATGGGRGRGRGNRKKAERRLI